MTSSAVATATSSAPAGPTTCSVSLYDTPDHDANCAIAYGGNHTDIMSACCGKADIVSYYDNCGLYCLAIDQTVKELSDCLFQHGAGWSEVFCRGNGTDTATGTGTALPTSAQASVVAGSGTATAKDGKKTDSPSGSSSASSSSSSSTSQSASASRPQAAGISKIGMAIGSLLISSVMFGALQI